MCHRRWGGRGGKIAGGGLTNGQGLLGGITVFFCSLSIVVSMMDRGHVMWRWGVLLSQTTSLFLVGGSIGGGDGFCWQV